MNLKNTHTTTYKDKVVIVTGGNSGIGREIAHQLAAYGARLYVCGRNQTTGKSLVRELHGKAASIVFEQVDVQDAAAVERLVERVVQAEGKIDYLFHCAGIILGGEVRDHKLEDIQNVLTTNVLGTAYASFYTYRHMAKQGHGHIVNVGSGAGLFPVPLMGVYSSSKFAVYGLGEILRMEGRGLGVRVSTAVPGIVDTPIYDRGTYSGTDTKTVKTIMKRKLLTISAATAADRILSGTARNRAFIHTQRYVRLSWLAYRYVPHVYRFACRLSLVPYRRRLRKTA